jgi:hypothetical protein
MRFSIFKLTVRHHARDHEEYVVAPDKARAEEVAREMVPDPGWAQFKLERIDEASLRSIATVSMRC